MKKTIIRIVAVAMLALMVLTALPCLRRELRRHGGGSDPRV